MRTKYYVVDHKNKLRIGENLTQKAAHEMVKSLTKEHHDRNRFRCYVEELYVITINSNNRVLYLAYETPGTIDPKTHKTIQEPMGTFTTEIKDAMKLRDKGLAIAIAAGYNAEVIRV